MLTAGKQAPPADSEDASDRHQHATLPPRLRRTALNPANVDSANHSSGGEGPEGSDTSASSDEDEAEKTEDDGGLEDLERHPKALAKLFVEEAAHLVEPDAALTPDEPVPVLRKVVNRSHTAPRHASQPRQSSPISQAYTTPSFSAMQPMSTSKDTVGKKRAAREAQASDSESEEDAPPLKRPAPAEQVSDMGKQTTIRQLVSKRAGKSTSRGRAAQVDEIPRIKESDATTSLTPKKGETRPSESAFDDPHSSSSDDSGVDLILPREGRLRLKEQHRRVRRVIQHGIEFTLAEVCLQNAFPDSSQDHLKMVYRAILKAADELDDQDIVRRLKKKDNYAAELCKIPLQRIPIFRGNVRKLVEGVPITTFHMRFGDKEKGEWLLRNHRFLYPHDYEAKTIEAGKIYSPDIFVEMLRLAFFKQPDAFGFEISSRFYSSLPEKPDEVELPAPMLALIATAARDFTANNYWSKYKDFINELSSIRMNGPQQYHVLMHGLWRRIMDPSSGGRGHAGTPHTSLVDVAAMAVA
ncbi:hypothetical protein C8Q77DRAFT_1074678 [Trametes polyzona]|nr:hypothetical protein C8Q77DRAFT_1074678 [Trametes polyzona]